MTSRSIVVGTDFSKAASCAVVQASQLAWKIGAPLKVLHVSNPGVFSGQSFNLDFPIEGLVRSLRTGAEEALAGIVSECQALGCDATGIFEEGIASRIVPRVAEQERAQLVVVGRKGSAFLSHVLLGSVSERIVRSAICPVLVVPADEIPPVLPRRLLVGVDFSSASREALQTAIVLGDAIGCDKSMVLAHAYQDERAEWLASWSEINRRLHVDQSESSVRDWVEKHSPNANAFEVHLLAGPAERVLKDCAQGENCDWIVLGLQGRTALASFLLGSTTRAVLEAADRAVLVVPAKGAPDREGID